MKTKLVPIVVTTLISWSPIAAVIGQSAQPMMKAAVLHEHGGPDVLKYEDVPRPEPKDDEVLVRVMAAGVNPVDTYVRQGMRSKGGSLEQPMILGYDIAGAVEKAGANVKTFKPGDAVYAYLSVPRGGGYAEFSIAKPEEMARKPTNIDFEKAAAVPLAGTTAASARRHGEDRGRTDGADSWRFRRGRKFRGSNCQGTRCQSDRNRFDRE
jgi:NADPH:quinone reductase-like Zn-dependent oxidoreductase